MTSKPHLFCIAVPVLLCAGRMAGHSRAQTIRAKPPSSNAEITLCAVGDILLDRGVAKEIERHGLHYPFGQVAPMLKSADVAFGNLECPIASEGTKIVKQFVFKAKPEYSPMLRDAGFDMLSLANNHTLDCGRTGLLETMQNLQRHNIRWTGAGRNRSEAERATILNVRGVRIAFVGFCEFLPEGVFTNDEKPGIAFASAENVRRVVSAARRQSDVVVASFHWGTEYANRPRALQTELAHVAARSGADLVLGHHPHVLQGLQMVVTRDASTRKVHRTLVAYSLGNFVFDPARERGAAPTETIVLRCRLRKSGIVAAQAVPMKIDNTRPRQATSAEAKAILSRLAALSRELKTHVTSGRVDMRPVAR
ncbi:MAG TPA: CapA family protein [Abditibacteriaceae bacterium]|jgi:poly-gamma-glutamate synthesis protein (capsule biosynthesis protein)